MPPFQRIGAPACSTHRPQEQSPQTLRRHRQIGAAMVGQRGEGVKAGPQIEGRPGSGIQQIEIEGHPARMGRSLARVGEEFGVGTGGPQAPLRLGRTEGIAQPQPQPERPGQSNRPFQRGDRIAMQPGSGPRAIDRAAGEIIGGGIGQSQLDREGRGGDGNQGRHLRSFLAAEGAV